MNFIINSNERNLDTSIGSGLCIPVKVKGFWSHDAINIYVSRSMFRVSGEVNREPSYKVSINHSSGGRDGEEVACDVEAAQYFGEAMLGAVKYVNEEIKPRLEMWEKMYQEERAVELARIEAAKKAKEEKFNDDVEVGTKDAKAIAQQMRAGEIKQVVLFDRGATTTHTLTRSTRASGQVHFNNEKGARYTFDQLVSAIACSSKSRMIKR